jgi:hypothetical protein
MTRAVLLAFALLLPLGGFAAAARDEADLPAHPPAAADSDRAALEPLAKSAGLPAESLQSLTGEQVFALLRAEQNSGGDDEAAYGSLAAILTTSAVFGSVVLIVGLSLYAGYRRRLMQHETVRQALERGAALPPHLLDPAPNPDADLRRGILLVSLGAGIGLLLAVLPDTHGAWGTGFVLGLLGLGYLLSWYLIGRRRAAAEPTA